MTKTFYQFYQRFDFVSSPVNDLHLYLLSKDVRSMASRPGVASS
jgi:hypothetical protein